MSKMPYCYCCWLLLAHIAYCLLKGSIADYYCTESDELVGDWHVGQIQQTAFCDLPSVSSPFSTKKVCLGVI